VTAIDAGVLARYWPKVRQGAADECWPWTAFTNPRGYGMFRVVAGRMDLVHRLAWEIANGPIPDGLQVLHHCDNPPCCNPAHLFVGTNADKVAKGRASYPHPWRQGERHHGAKLTAEQVREIRAADVTAPGARAALAKQYGVTPGLITNILKGKVWKSLLP
jgi:hypothetical protein